MLQIHCGIDVCVRAQVRMVRQDVVARHELIDGADWLAVEIPTQNHGEITHQRDSFNLIESITQGGWHLDIAFEIGWKSQAPTCLTNAWVCHNLTSGNFGFEKICTFEMQISGPDWDFRAEKKTTRG